MQTNLFVRLQGQTFRSKVISDSWHHQSVWKKVMKDDRGGHHCWKSVKSETGICPPIRNKYWEYFAETKNTQGWITTQPWAVLKLPSESWSKSCWTSADWAETSEDEAFGLYMKPTVLDLDRCWGLRELQKSADCSDTVLSYHHLFQSSLVCSCIFAT